jgi:GrpB-like predicted nucleotidyltransferase (UPF0157 family)
MRIKISPYNQDWTHDFQRIKTEIAGILSSLNPVIEHIGSTSVPGLAAKPVIDIVVGLKHYDDLDKSIEPMIAHGYIYYEVFNSVMPERRLYVKLKDSAHLKLFKSRYKENDALPHDEINTLRLAHVHIWEYGTSEWIRHIAFRDYLRAHPKVCNEYAELKNTLSKRTWKHGMEYNDGKNDFIKIVQAKAVKWYHDQRK